MRSSSSPASDAAQRWTPDPHGLALPLAGCAAYLAGALATLAGARLAFGAALPLRGALGSGWLWLGLLAPVTLGLWLRRDRAAAGYWQLAWALLGAAALINLAAGLAPLRSYGDGAYLRGLVERGEPYPRWLVGTAAASWAYAALWRIPPLAARLPAALAAADGFISFIGALAMAGGSILLLRRWPGRLAVLLPTLVPVWLMFASGYREYYPLVAWAVLAALAWLFDEPLGQRPPAAVGAVAAGLPLLYIGFAPLGAMALAAYALARPGRAWRACAWAGAALLALILACWPAGVSDFFRSLYGQLNLGEANTEFPRYLGRSAGPDSIFFRADYALSREHLLDVGYMLFWGGGLVTVALLPAGLLLALRARAWAVGPLLRDRRAWLAAAVLLWQGYYLLFMIPKLGPTRDVDLFFTTFITLAFFAGWALDLAGPLLGARARIALVSAQVGGSATALCFLLDLGLPSR